MSPKSNKKLASSALSVRSEASGKFLKSSSVDKHPRSVTGGLVSRDSKTGRFLEVKTGNSVSKASSKSFTSVKSASTKRAAALRRLANR